MLTQTYNQAGNMRNLFLQIAAIILFSASIASAADIKTFVNSQPQPMKNINFSDESANIISLSDLKGKVIVLNFWATWCTPCVHEMPALSKLQADLEREGIKVITVSIDYEGIKAVKDFYAEQGIENLPAYIDNKGSSFKALQLNALPITFIINKKGEQVAKIPGEIDWNSHEVKDYLIFLAKEMRGK